MKQYEAIRKLLQEALQILDQVEVEAEAEQDFGRRARERLDQLYQENDRLREEIAAMDERGRQQDAVIRRLTEELQRLKQGGEGE